MNNSGACRKLLPPLVGVLPIGGPTIISEQSGVVHRNAARIVLHCHDQATLVTEGFERFDGFLPSHICLSTRKSRNENGMVLIYPFWVK